MEASEVKRGRSDAAASAPLRLEAFLPYRLNVLAAAVSEGLAKVYSERFGLDIPGWRVLATLGQFGPVSAKRIGAHSRMHKTKVSRAVAELEQRALVRRAANPGDKREAIVALTAKGEATYREIVPLALAYERDVLAAFAADEARLLEAALVRLAESADKMNRAADASG
jgi:DNA-binding MarR family transcriptional regulator